MIESPGLSDAFFPDGANNIGISISTAKGLSALAANDIVDFHFNGDTQFFPMFWYENIDNEITRHDAITDEALEVFRKAYPEVSFFSDKNGQPRSKDKGGPQISKEDIFYYIYGILHSPEYRERFAANLKKELPRIPLSKNFKMFSAMGRELAELHLHYESMELYPLEIVGNIENPGHVQKMRWGKKKDPESGKRVDDKSTLIYNGNLTLRGIPKEAQRYVVNGRTPLEWMVDRYQVKTDKPSGIVNDPNEYSEDPLYILNLVRRLVTVSVETMKIIDVMPALAEKEQPEHWPEAWNTDEN